MSAHRHAHRASALPAHRGRPREHRSVRRVFTTSVLAIASGLGFLVAAGPAQAAGPWWVAASPAGSNTATCGLSSATPCATVSFVIAKAGFADGDTINVAAGTYTDRPAFAAKTANVVGAGAGSTTFTGSATSFAMSVNIGNAKTFKLSNATLTAGKGAVGGALPIASGQVVLSGVSVTNSTVTNVGGGISVNSAGASLTMTGGTISGSTATNGGGALYTGGTTTLNGVTLSGSTSASGGGVYVAGGSTLNVNNGAVSGNTGSSAGGGIYNLGTLKVTGATISGNSSPIGAGVATAGAPTFTDATVSNNTSTNTGGGIFNNGGTLVLVRTALTTNTAASGGGLYQQAGATTADSGSSFTQNTATTGGGGYVAGGTLTSNGADIVGNKATSLAGGLANAGTTTLNGGSLSTNTAPNGGALYNGATTTIDGTTVKANTADGGTVSNAGNGGAIYNAAALTVKNATFSGNKVVVDTNATPGVTGFGGAVFSASLSAAGAPTLSFTNTTIHGDNAGTPVAGGNASYGGAIAAAGNLGLGGANTVTTATNLTLSKNIALAGGGIYTTGSTTFTNSTLDQNKATHASAGVGGGVYAVQSGAAPTLTLDNTDVTANDGAAGGGGMVMGPGVTTVIKNGSTVSTNTGLIGAGVYNGGTLAVQDSDVVGNSASNSGGGIYTASAVTLTNAHVDGNTAAFLGGGLSTTSTGSFAATGGTVSGNNAYAAGGLLLGAGLTGTFDGTDFKDNTSTGANFGGGAVLSAGLLTIRNATLSGNTADGASGSGGAIFSGSGDENVTTTLKIANSTITGNDSFVGSAIYAGSSKASSTNKTSITNTTIHANAASGPFGAIEATDQVSISGSTITDNTAVPTSPYDAYGGIVAGSAGLVSLSGSILSGNTGHQCNAALADGGYNLNSPTASECALSAAKNDVFAAPQLGALAGNGGPTQTRLPGAASPALDRIPASTATGVTDAITGAAITLCGSGASDQRGTSRPQGAKCDIGAVEADQVVPTVTGPSEADYAVGSAGTPLTYTSTGSPQATLTATGLPSGVTLHDNGDGTGTISGTPAAGTGGSYPVVVKATNEAGSGTAALTLVVHEAPTVSGPATETYTVGQPGGPTKFTQTTGHPLGTFSSSGTLPTGVSFDGSVAGEGTYSGTPAAGTGGVYNLTVKDDNGTPPAATAPFKLTVNEATSAISGPATATFKVGTASLSGEFSATGFPVPTFSQTGLPAGLGLTSTGSGKVKIGGTAANGTGGLYGVDLTADNGVGSSTTKHVDVTVNEAPELVGPTEARFVTGTANAIGFSSDGYPVASISVSGSVPAWLDVQDNGNGSATLSGTAPANAVGTYAITVTASNGQSPDAVIHLTLEVVPPVSISTSSLPNAAYRTAYSAQVTATGGQPGYSFQVVSGALPQGLSMSSFGLITGSPTGATGTSTFTVKVTDSANPAQTATRQLSIKVEKGVTSLAVDPVVVQTSGLNIKFGIVSATLTGGFPVAGVSGQTIVFKAGTTTVCTGVTDANGRVARCEVSLLNTLKVISNGGVSATYAGNTQWLPSSGSAGLVG